MTDINPAAAAARESARTATGKFGAQEHSAPELSLSTTYVPGQPVYATVTYQEYASEHDEHPVEIFTQKVDIASVLDTMSLEDVEHLRADPWADGDSIVYALQSAGELTHPAHPFELNVEGEDLAPYTEYRSARAQSDPLAERPSPSLVNLSAALAAHNDAISALREQIAEAEAEKEKTEERILRTLGQKACPNAKTLVVQLDHSRYPVEVYDAGGWVNLGEEAEHRLAEEIRAVLGTDASVVGGRGTSRVIELSEPSA